MIVKVIPGAPKVYREGLLMGEEDGPLKNGMFRLYKTPQDHAYEDEKGKRVVPTVDEFLGESLREATEDEAEEYIRHEQGRGFEDSALGTDPTEAYGRAGRIAMAVAGLDPENDEHWTRDDLPACEAVEEASGLTDVRRHEIDATVPTARRPR